MKTNDSDSSEPEESWLWRLQPLVFSTDEDLESRRYRAEEQASKLRRRKIRNGVIVKPACKQVDNPSQEAYIVASGDEKYVYAPVWVLWFVVMTLVLLRLLLSHYFCSVACFVSSCCCDLYLQHVQLIIGCTCMFVSLLPIYFVMCIPSRKVRAF